MKEAELRKYATCANCHKKIGQTGIPFFYLVTLERFGLDAKAIERQHGLGLVLGGNGFLAMHMGPDHDLAKPLMEPIKVMVCELCSHGEVSIMHLAANEEAEDPEELGEQEGMPSYFDPEERDQ